MPLRVPFASVLSERLKKKALHWRFSETGYTSLWHKLAVREGADACVRMYSYKRLRVNGDQIPWPSFIQIGMSKLYISGIYLRYK